MLVENKRYLQTWHGTHIAFTMIPILPVAGIFRVNAVSFEKLYILLFFVRVPIP